MHNIADPKQTALLERAVQIAVKAHAGQWDRGGLPYILHPLRLMLQMSSPAAMMVAVLHDVVEDSAWTLESLRKEGFPEEVIAAVDALTHRAGETYDDYLQRVKQNPLAVVVKLRDLEDNSNILRLQALEEKDCRRLQQYHRAYRYLTTGKE